MYEVYRHSSDCRSHVLLPLVRARAKARSNLHFYSLKSIYSNSSYSFRRKMVVFARNGETIAQRDRRIWSFSLPEIIFHERRILKILFLSAKVSSVDQWKISVDTSNRYSKVRKEKSYYDPFRLISKRKTFGLKAGIRFLREFFKIQTRVKALRNFLS